MVCGRVPRVRDAQGAQRCETQWSNGAKAEPGAARPARAAATPEKKSLAHASPLALKYFHERNLRLH